MDGLFGFDLFGDPIRKPSRGPLADRFTVPPFSVLNARDGDWQDRKRAWLACGIKGEMGRGANCLSLSGQCEDYRTRTASYQTARPHASHSATPGRVSGDYDGGDRWVASGNDTGTSVFDPVLCELAYRWFCPPGGQVVDPFAGGSVRGIVAALLGRRYWGCDLRPEQIAANEEQAAEIVPEERPTWVAADAMDALADAPDADFVFSCPPYGDLERYSDEPRDLSAMEWHTFCAAYRRIIMRAVARLKRDRFAVFVVGDFRDPRTGFYRGFVGETERAFREQGCELYNEAVLVTAVGSLPIRAGKQFAAGRKLGKTHQNVLVFVKGSGMNAAKACETF